MLGEYSELLLFLPILIWGAVGIIILAVLYDYLRRNRAKMIVDTIRSAGADSPENAKSSDELEAVSKGFKRCAAFLLKKHSTLRRYVKCTLDAEENIKFDISGADGTSHINKKEEKTDKEVAKAAKAAERAERAKRNSLIDKSFSRKGRKLTGKEKWYIEPYTSADDSDAEAARERMPYLLRDGGEHGFVFVIVGCVAIALLGGVIVHFLPTIMDFFVELTEIKG